MFFEEHTLSVILFAIVLSIVYLFMYRKYFDTVFDPLFLVVVIAGLSSSTVFLLYYHNIIKTHYFLQFLWTEIAFLAGFFLIRPINFKAYKNAAPIAHQTKSNEEFALTLFYWCSIIHVILQLLTYKLIGLPILMDSRMATFTGGGGFGIVGRIIEVTSTVGTFLLFYRIFYVKNSFGQKFYNYIYLLLVIFFQLASGNKTNMLFLVYFLFILNLFMLKIKGREALHVINKVAKYQKYIIIASIPLIFAVIYIQYVNSGADVEKLSALSSLVFRVVSFGDIYYMTLPNDVITHMNNDSAFLQLFKDPLGFFRIVPWNNLPIDCGIEIYQYHITDNAIGGPNARYNYFAMLYFNPIGQFLYCFFLGLIVSFLRNMLFMLMSKNIVYGALYALVTFNIIYIYQDQAFTLARFLNIIMFFPLMLLLSLLTIELKKINIKNNE